MPDDIKAIKEVYKEFVRGDKANNGYALTDITVAYPLFILKLILSA